MISATRDNLTQAIAALKVEADQLGWGLDSAGATIDLGWRESFQVPPIEYSFARPLPCGANSVILTPSAVGCAEAMLQFDPSSGILSPAGVAALLRDWGGIKPKSIAAIRPKDYPALAQILTVMLAGLMATSKIAPKAMELIDKMSDEGGIVRFQLDPQAPDRPGLGKGGWIEMDADRVDFGFLESKSGANNAAILVDCAARAANMSGEMARKLLTPKEAMGFMRLGASFRGASMDEA